MNTDHKYIVVLCGQHYEVLIKDGKPLVRICSHNGPMWLEADCFVDYLCDLNLWDQVSELAKYGLKSKSF